MKPIHVHTTVPASRSEAWHLYTEAEHVINWNFASEDWHCPKAVNDLREGGDFKITMAAKDGSMEFDLAGTYDEIKNEEHIAYTLNNGRQVTVDFSDADGGTKVDVKFEPEKEQKHDEQREGWQSILNNFKSYAEKVSEKG